MVYPGSPKMNLKLFVFLFLFPSSLMASDSEILRDLMGEEVFEKSGLTTLDQDQLDVLEKWVSANMVLRSLSQTELETFSSRAEATELTNPSDKKSKGLFRRTMEIFRSDKDVEEREDTKGLVSPDNDNEPVTQKYVLVDSIKQEQVVTQPDLIRSRIDGPFRGWRGNKTRFRLENGEVWEQRQSSTFFAKLDSPEVIIKRGRFGYTMEVPSIGKRVHVKKIK